MLMLKDIVILIHTLGICRFCSINCFDTEASCCRYEKDFTYDSFAAQLVRDLDLPECFHKRISTSIESQVEKAKRCMPWYEAVTNESLHPIFINIRLNDTLYMDRFEVSFI